MSTPPLNDEVLQRAVDTRAKHKTDSEAAKALQLSRSTFQNQLRRARESGFTPSDGSVLVHTKTNVGNTEEDFRKRFDKAYIVPKKIEEALKLLGRSWYYEADFCRLAGITPPDLQAYRDHYADYHFEAREVGNKKRMIWCGDRALATKLRESQR